MAKDKKAFIVYSNWEQTFENLTDEEAGRLIKHLFRYVNDREPVAPDRITEIVFEPLKAVIKVDLKKYEKVIENKSYQGKLGNLKRWHNDLFLLVENNTISLDEAEVKALNRKTSVSDKNIAVAIKPLQNIADNVNDNDNVNVINKIEARSQIFKDSLLQYKDKYQVNMLKEFYNYWTEPNQSKTKMRFELQKTWSLDRRLETWAKRENSFNVKPQIKQDRL
jgi:hypothetical protein